MAQMPGSRSTNAPGQSSALSGLRSNLGGTTGVYVNPDDPEVYLGRGPARLRPSDITDDGEAIKQRRRKGREETAPRSSVLAQFYEWDEAERAEWGRYLVSVGRIEEDEVDDFEILKDEWISAVDEASRFRAAGKAITPRDAAKIMGVAGGLGGKANTPFTGRKSRTDRRVDLTSPEDARGLISEVLREQLGRDPRPEELDEFTKVLNTAQRANPVVQTTHTDFVDGEAVGSTAETSGGLSGAGATELLIEQARRKPNYGAYQAASTFYNALMTDLIQSPV